MKYYQLLLKELDRCEYAVDYQYAGQLSDYTYNDISYSESVGVYSQVLEKMYLDFLYEWGDLSDAEKTSAKGIVELIVTKRFLCGEFFYDVPSSEIIDAMVNDEGVPCQSVKMARFVHDMAEQQKFYLQQVASFLGVDVIKEQTNHAPVMVAESVRVVEGVKEVDLEEVCGCDVSEKEEATHDKEWVSYDELIQMFDFRGVKSAKDAKWRKKMGFDKCVKQAGGKGCAVIYNVSKVKDWLNNESIPKKK